MFSSRHESSSAFNTGSELPTEPYAHTQSCTVGYMTTTTSDNDRQWGGDRVVVFNYTIRNILENRHDSLFKHAVCLCVLQNSVRQALILTVEFTYMIK